MQIEEEAVANWSKHDLPLILKTFDSIIDNCITANFTFRYVGSHFYHSQLADQPTGTIWRMIQHQSMLQCAVPTLRMFQVLFVMHCVNYRYLNLEFKFSDNRHWKPFGRQSFETEINMVILRGEFTFYLMGRSFTVVSNLGSPHIYAHKNMLPSKLAHYTYFMHEIFCLFFVCFVLFLFLFFKAIPD